MSTWFVTVSNLNSLHDKLILGNLEIHWCFVSFLNNESNFTSAQAITILYIEFENYEFKITVTSSQWVNSLRPRQNRRRFADDIFKRIFLSENKWIPIKISVKFYPKGPINNIPALFQIMAWRRPGDKPLSETMMVILLTHICVTRPQWVKVVEAAQILPYGRQEPTCLTLSAS